MASTCPACGKGNIVSKTWMREFEHEGKTLEAEYTEDYCNACGTLMQSPETIRRNLSMRTAVIEESRKRSFCPLRTTEKLDHVDMESETDRIR